MSAPTRGKRFYRWAQTAAPHVRSIVRTWIAELGDQPWQFPSVPIPELSNPPAYEIRTAIVPDTTVLVVYRREFQGEIIDLHEVS